MFILYRPEVGDDPDEIAALKESGIPYSRFRTEIPENSLVVGRYSVLPYYSEVEGDVKNRNSEFANSETQHRFLADILQVAPFLEGLTPPAYSTWIDLPEDSYFLKGKTNSRKTNWETHCFAKTAKDVPTIARRLLDDTFIRDQGIVVRPYIPLETFDVGINGMPVTNEWRFFFWGNQEVAHGYYWANFEEFADQAVLDPEGIALAQKVANKVAAAGKAKFFVVDVAKTQKGNWICIELNDGQMSGLCCIDPTEFYQSLKRIVS